MLGTVGKYSLLVGLPTPLPSEYFMKETRKEREREREREREMYVHIIFRLVENVADHFISKAF